MSEKYTKQKSEIIVETKKIANDLVKNVDLAKKAIHDRNIIIKSLKADIDHRKIAFKEIESRYTEISDNFDIVEKQNEELHTLNENLKIEISVLNNSLNQKTQENENIKNENRSLRIQIEKNRNLWRDRVESLCEILPEWLSKIIKFFFTPPVSSYISLILFCLFFIASISGWKFVVDTFLIPIGSFFKLFIGG